MIEALARLLDWSSIQAATLMMPGDASMPKLEEALQFIKGPNFIPAESQPAQIEFNGPLHFRFATPRPCEFEENNVVHGRLYRCDDQWRKKPAIILLPGWNDSASYQLRFPPIARDSNRAGFNVATLVSPYQFQRCPPKRSPFDRVDCIQFAQATAQGIAEIRAMIGWLLAQGCPAVALWGYSMGAWYSAMVVCHDARLSAAVAASPPARNRPSLEQQTILPRVRANLPRIREVCEAFDQTVSNLTTIRPAIPREKILLIEGIHDLLCPKEDIDDLWQAWGKTDIWRLPHGHVSICCGFVPGLSKRILCWVSQRLKEPNAKARPTEAIN
ncbi:MAG TPA: alpha/beta hydrolase family protein [Verrucomicrobiae bacterium]